MIIKNNSPIFTIFTSTYNRGYVLPKLYESLKKQTNYNFEWLVVDDGSTDNTEDLFEEWKNENNPFPIIYCKKENGGKPRAINYGVTRARGRYFFMVDSDDWLKSEAVQKMTEWVEEIDNKQEYIGVGAARGYVNGKYLKGIAPKVNDMGYVDATNLERAKYDLDADMCEAYKIEIFKQFPMAEWKGEKFAPEQIALNEIALQGYKLRWHKDIIYICDYLEDGLTKGSRKLEKENPMGYAMMYNHKLKYKLSIKERIHAACQVVALSIYGKCPQYILQTNAKVLTLFVLPVGIILSCRRKVQFSGVE